MNPWLATTSVKERGLVMRLLYAILMNVQQGEMSIDCKVEQFPVIDLPTFSEL